MPRTFIAVDVPVNDKLHDVNVQLSQMGQAVKLVRHDVLHITLKYLGETAADLLPEINQRLETIAAETRVLQTEIIGLGAFPHAGRPSVIWAGLAEHAKAWFAEVVSELERYLEALGFPPEQRNFHPHVTLARVKAKPPPELAELLEHHEKTVFGSLKIDQLVFYQSELQKSGPFYTVLKSFSIANTKSA